MARPDGLGRLDPSEWERLLEYVDRFEKASHQKANATDALDLREFLPPAEDALRPAVLHELVKTDLEIRWRDGVRVLLEDYLARYPELGDAGALAPELLYEEYRVRQLFGDRPTLDSYEGRFPAQFDGLRQLVDDQPLPTRSKLGAGTSPAPPSASPLPPEGTGQVLSVGGGYELLEYLGGGGFGNVWRAKAPGGVEVAIKRISRPLDHNERQRESQALELIKQLRHAYLLQTHAFYPLPGELIIAMELADGSLRDRLKQCRKEGKKGIPPGELLGYFREAADALDFLHSRNVQHRDIKPDNILLQQHHAKVADFGLARPQDLEKSMLDSGSGTPPYTAPEVWLGKIKPGSDSDQYSLAVTYAELRLDRRLYPGTALMELMLAHVQGTPDLSPLSEQEQQALLRALAKDPAKRYPSCREFVSALEAALGKELKLSGQDQTFSEGRALPLASPRSGGKTDVDTIIPSIGATRAPLVPSESDTLAQGGRGMSSPVTDQTKPDWRPTAPKKKLAGTPRLFKAAAMFLVLVAAGIAGYALFRDRIWPPINLLPPGCKKADDAELVIESGSQHFDHIYKVLPDGTEVEFILLPAINSTSKPYYFMADKVSVDLFKKYVDDVATNPKHEFWGSAWKKYINDPTWTHKPIMDVTAYDAYNFATWMGGSLPTPDEWDSASGLDLSDPTGDSAYKGKGPYQPCTEPWQGKIGVEIEAPLDNRGGTHDYFVVKRYKKDRTIYDLAGNGREWTGEMQLVGEPIASAIARIKALKQADRVILRGQSFFAEGPLEYKDYQLEHKRKGFPKESVELTTSRKDIGFRVVIHPEDRAGSPP